MAIAYTTEELQEFFYLSTDEKDVIYVLFLKEAQTYEEGQAVAVPLARMVQEQVKAILEKHPEQEFGYIENMLPLRRKTVKSVSSVAQPIYREICEEPQIRAVAYIVSNPIYDATPMNELVGGPYDKPMAVFYDFAKTVAWVKKEIGSE